MENVEYIIKENAGLIWNVAKKFFDTNKNDLYQAGVLGIIKALQNYQKDGDVKFSTYAYKYIYGEMYNVATNKTIKQSKDLLRLVKMIEMGRVRLSQELLREPTKQELARFLEIDEYQMEAALLSLPTVMSMDEESDEARSLHEVISYEENLSLDDKILLNESIDTLGSLEKEIINARYFEDLTQSETAKKLGITQVMVSRYESRSLSKMRDFMYM